MTTASFPPVNFEQTYLQENEDVCNAVQRGVQSSGWNHYVTFGHNEFRLGVPTEVRRIFRALCGDPSTEPLLPPSELRKRVHGCTETSSFERVGKTSAIDLYSTLVSTMQLDENSRILDFGCGCGRVIKYLQRLFPSSKFVGTDIDNDAITWCQDNLSHVAEFLTNYFQPPLPFADGAFDCVYAISVFTHLPEDMQFDWLDELRRVTRPGGRLFLSTHGEELLADVLAPWRQLREDGFYYSVGAGEEGLPSFYQTSFHTEQYVQSRWSKFFEIERIQKRAVNKSHDLVLCRRRAA